MTKEVYLYYLLILNVIVPNSNIVDFVHSISHVGNLVEEGCVGISFPKLFVFCALSPFNFLLSIHLFYPPTKAMKPSIFLLGQVPYFFYLLKIFNFL